MIAETAQGGTCMEQNYEQRGYLKEDYRLFHLNGAMEERLDWHYHTFHKIILFLSGSASYGIEGRSYPLRPGDLVLVPQGCIHRPEIEPGTPYERVIVYLSADFLRRSSTAECALERCFTQAKEQFRFVVRPQGKDRGSRLVLAELENEMQQEGFGQKLLSDALLFQFLIGIARGMQAHALAFTEPDSCDEKTAAILQYLSEHLTEPVSIDDLAAHFFVSKYHMMRRFREQTGYTIHNYLVSKRLMLARELIAGGMRVREASDASGFGDYSAFSRAYKRQFGEAPGTVRTGM